ncbi:DUF3021 domain-containing protein [Bacillus piscicola]|uniref:DUF3021 domain-containing protein n=1 Tax=Bacillus piscicola TaxID=1632684 RepID=UPI001F08C1F2|nr:DUF3021 domain-containing protein [Bacillus piscicola]
MKTFLWRSVIGIFYGAFLMVIVTNGIVLMGGHEQLDGGLFLKNSLGFMFCGWFFTVTPLFFEMNRLHLFQQTALHFVTVTVLYFTLSLGVGWIPFNARSIIFFTVIFLVIYLIIWSVFYFYHKNAAKKLNEELHKI